MALLKSKLARLGRPQAPPAVGVAAEAARVAQLKAAMLARFGGTALARGRAVTGARWPEERGEAADLEGLPGGDVETPYGRVYVVGRTHLAEHRHGVVRVAGCLEVAPRHVATLALDAVPADLDLSRALFLDTETTGLAGGTGTVPFLVGLGSFVQGAWCTEQLLLRQPGDEGPLLRHLAARVQQASVVVTFNGKAYDWPLLRTRFILNRLQAPDVGVHLDLLHCMRRVLKRRHMALRLVNIEREWLGFRRVGDINGAAIPAIYFDYLRGAKASSLLPVITHNAHDLTAMAAMIAQFGQMIEGSVEIGRCGLIVWRWPSCWAEAGIAPRPLLGRVPRRKTWRQRRTPCFFGPAGAPAKR